MKYLIAIALLAAAPAYADDTPKRLSLDRGSSFELQGWTRLNGTAAFQKTQTRTQTTNPRATPDLKRRLALEAEYQREKARQERKGTWGY